MTDYPVYTGMRSAGPALIARGTGFIAALLVLPVFLIAGFDIAGWALGTGIFAVNWLAALGIDRLARGKMQVTAVGITGVGLISRAWITFGGLFVFAQLVDENVGVVAAVVFLIVFTADFLARAIAHTVARPGPPSDKKESV
jgi:hypothetical protein